MYKKLAHYALLCLATIIPTISLAIAAHTDIQGLMQNNVYTNSILDFSIKLPEDWNASRFRPDSPSHLVKQENMKSANAIVDIIKDSSIPLFSVDELTKAPQKASIIAKVFKFYPADEGEFAAPEQLLEQIKFALFKISSIKPDAVSEIHHTRLGGLEFDSMDIKFRFNDYVITETMYAAIRKDYILFFVTSYNNKEQEIAIQKTFNTMLFY